MLDQYLIAIITGVVSSIIATMIIQLLIYHRNYRKCYVRIDILLRKLKFYIFSINRDIRDGRIDDADATLDEALDIMLTAQHLLYNYHYRSVGRRIMIAVLQNMVNSYEKEYVLKNTDREFTEYRNDQQRLGIEFSDVIRNRDTPSDLLVMEFMRRLNNHGDIFEAGSELIKVTGEHDAENIKRILLSETFISSYIRISNRRPKGAITEKKFREYVLKELESVN